MSILGALVRTSLATLPDVSARLAGMPGVDLALNPGDGRLVVVLEDLPEATATAAQHLAAITAWPEVLSTSLVYEYSGPDAPAPAGSEDTNYRSWRDSLAQIKTAAGLEPVQGKNPAAAAGFTPKG